MIIIIKKDKCGIASIFAIGIATPICAPMSAYITIGWLSKLFTGKSDIREPLLHNCTFFVIVTLIICGSIYLIDTNINKSIEITYFDRFKKVKVPTWLCGTLSLLSVSLVCASGCISLVFLFIMTIDGFDTAGINMVIFSTISLVIVLILTYILPKVTKEI